MARGIGPPSLLLSTTYLVQGFGRTVITEASRAWRALIDSSAVTTSPDTDPSRTPAPVFVDPSGRRAHRARRWALVLALPAAAYALALGSSVLGGPSLPSALLPPAVPDAAPAHTDTPASEHGGKAGGDDRDGTPAGDSPDQSTPGGTDDPGSTDDPGTPGDNPDDPATPAPTEQVTAPAPTPTTPAPTTPAPTTPAPTTPTPATPTPTSPGKSEAAQDAHKKTDEEKAANGNGGSSSTAPGQTRASTS